MGAGLTVSAIFSRLPVSIATISSTSARSSRASPAIGCHFEGHAESGMLEPGELDDKFLRLTRREPGTTALYKRLQKPEDERNLDWLS
jgi:hypothetical protein